MAHIFKHEFVYEMDVRINAEKLPGIGQVIKQVNDFTAECGYNQRLGVTVVFNTLMVTTNVELPDEQLREMYAITKARLEGTDMAKEYSLTVEPPRLRKQPALIKQVAVSPFYRGAETPEQTGRRERPRSWTEPLQIGDGTAPAGFPSYRGAPGGKVECTFNGCGHLGINGKPCQMACVGYCNCPCCRCLGGETVHGVKIG